MRQLKINKSITSREEQSLDKYLKEIGRVDLITAEEEVDLAKKIREWDQDALEKLTKANLRFVVSVSKQYQNQWLSLPDLINEGNLWLIKAAQRFDETRWFKFISYAVWRIRQSLLQALAEQSRIVRLPLNQVGSINKINKMFSRLEQKYDRPPTVDELAEALEMEPVRVAESLKVSWRHVSVDAPFQGDETNQNLLDIMVSETPQTDGGVMAEWLLKEIERSLSTLSDKEAEVIRLFYGIGKSHGMTLEEIWAKFNLTRERVRQIKEKAIKRLRHTSRSTLLRQYLG